MNKKMKYLIKSSLKAKIKNKWFLVSNIVLALLIIGISNIDYIIDSFGGDFEKSLNITVIDETKTSYDSFEEKMNVAVENFKIKTKVNIDKTDKTIKEATLDIKKEKDVLLIIKDDEKNYITSEIISKGYIDTSNYQALIAALNNLKTEITIKNSNVSKEEISKLYTPIEAKRTFLDEDKTTKGEASEMIMGTVFPLFILPFFMFNILVVQMIGSEINNEKSTKGMEIIISNVSAKTHLISKVVAVNLFVFLQGILIFSYGALGFLIRRFTDTGKLPAGMTDQLGQIWDILNESGVANNLIFIIPMALILIVLTLIGYSILSALLASMTTNSEDFQQMQTPLIIISLIGYYLSIMSGMFKGAVFIKILSYIPFISALLSPSLLIVGQITMIDFFISTFIMILTNYLLIKFGLRVYKVGILNYSSTGLWKKTIEALKKKKA